MSFLGTILRESSIQKFEGLLDTILSMLNHESNDMPDDNTRRRRISITMALPKALNHARAILQSRRRASDAQIRLAKDQDIAKSARDQNATDNLWDQNSDDSDSACSEDPEHNIWDEDSTETVWGSDSAETTWDNDSAETVWDNDSAESAYDNGSAVANVLGGWDNSDDFIDCEPLNTRFESWQQSKVDFDERNAYRFDVWHPESTVVYRSTTRLSDLVGRPFMDCPLMAEWTFDMIQDHWRYKKPSIMADAISKRYERASERCQGQILTDKQRLAFYLLARARFFLKKRECHLRLAFLIKYPSAFVKHENHYGHIKAAQWCLDEMETIGKKAVTYWDSMTSLRGEKPSWLSSEYFRQQLSGAADAIRRIEAISIHLPEEYDALKMKKDAFLQQRTTLGWEGKMSWRTNPPYPSLPHLQPPNGMSNTEREIFRMREEVQESEAASITTFREQIKQWESKWRAEKDGWSTESDTDSA
ncbi:MAG: hypothetical protein Q9227_005202 [Pyrenula ochraceoflavens]